MTDNNTPLKLKKTDEGYTLSVPNENGSLNNLDRSFPNILVAQQFIAKIYDVDISEVNIGEMNLNQTNIEQNIDITINNIDSKRLQAINNTLINNNQILEVGLTNITSEFQEMNLNLTNVTHGITEIRDELFELNDTMFDLTNVTNEGMQNIDTTLKDGLGDINETLKIGNNIAMANLAVDGANLQVNNERLNVEVERLGLETTKYLTELDKNDRNELTPSEAAILDIAVRRDLMTQDGQGKFEKKLLNGNHKAMEDYLALQEGLVQEGHDLRTTTEVRNNIQTVMDATEEEVTHNFAAARKEYGKKLEVDPSVLHRN